MVVSKQKIFQFLNFNCIKHKLNQFFQPYTYPELISMAINNAPGKKSKVNEIYEFIMENFPYYQQENIPGWKNSTSHTLTMNKCFKKGKIYFLIKKTCLFETVK